MDKNDLESKVLLTVGATPGRFWLFIHYLPAFDMHMITRWLQDERKTYAKAGLLLAVSYFFVGVSEGAFFFQNGVDTLFNFAFTVICVALNWRLFKQLRHWFEQKAPGQTILLGRSVVMIMLLSVFTTALNWAYIELLWGERLSQTVFFPVVLPLAMLLFAIWVFGYQLVFREAAVDPKQLTLELRRGQQTVIQPVNQLLGFWVEHKLVFACTETGEKLLSDQTLTDLEELLTDEGFFRINRQLLLRREAVTGYRTINNERVELSLSDVMQVPSPGVVSRYKAPAFRQWIKN